MSRILVVEDNELNMRLFADLLESAGYDCIPCFESKKAVPLALCYQPALVLMDIQMPEISGLDLIKQMRRHPKLAHIKIIAVSAFASQEDQRRIKETGCDDYLSKPIEMDSFFKKVQKYAPIGD